MKGKKKKMLDYEDENWKVKIILMNQLDAIQQKQQQFLQKRIKLELKYL